MHGNAEEQLEAALIKALLAAQCRAINGRSVKTTYSVNETGQLVIDNYVIVEKSLENVKIDLKVL